VNVGCVRDTFGVDSGCMEGFEDLTSWFRLGHFVLSVCQ
jgi:hypothetical protein